MNIDRMLTLASNIVALLVGVFCGLAIVGFEGVEDWLYKWQALLAGVLAIVAAFLTMVIMLATDKRQQLRHDQLVKQNVRADRLKAQRCAARARMLYAMVEQTPDSDPQYANDVGFLPDPSRKFAMEVMQWRGLIHHETAHSSIVAAQDLFSANGVFCRDQMELDLEGTKRAVAALESAVEDAGLGPEMHLRLRARVKALSASVDKFARELIALEKSYD